MRFKRQVWVLGCLVLGVHFGAARAEVLGADGAFDSVAVYGARGVDHNLRDMPGVVLGRDGWKWQDSYFAGVEFSKQRGTLGTAIPGLRDTPFASMRHGYEVIFAKHHGLQHNGEIGAAYMLRTPDFYLGPVGVNAAAGLGFSYALGTPTYEDGPDDNPTRRYRFQALSLFEAEWKMKGVENWSVVTRLHHRCGFYGVIAPPHVGSNFVAVGVRYRF